MAPPKDNSWNVWRLLVLDKLDENAKDHAQLSGDVQTIKVEIAKLKIKSSLWDAAAGMLPALVVLIWQLLER